MSVLSPVSWLFAFQSVIFDSCVHCSLGMKRPFSDEEFGSTPNKMARGGEPKKGTVFVCVAVM